MDDYMQAEPMEPIPPGHCEGNLYETPIEPPVEIPHKRDWQDPGRNPIFSSADYADEHESGQLRIGVAGEQRPLLPLPDEQIPSLYADLTLHCPECGRRADMCFDHGDDWKKRATPLHLKTDAQLRAGVNEFTEDDPPPYDLPRLEFPHRFSTTGDDIPY